jgi:proteasome lid subunit RPN8/RPN11
MAADVQRLFWNVKDPQNRLRGDLRRHGEETYPHECCGVLLGEMDGEERRHFDRTLRQHAHGFAAEPLQHRSGNWSAFSAKAAERGEDIVGFYHSHPDHPARWSATDLAEAHWFGCSYVITSVEKGKAAITNSFELTGSDEGDKKLCG